MNRRPYLSALVATLCMLSGCGGPKYAAFEVALEDAPGETFLFSAGDASISSPIFVDIAGRDPTVADKKYRMQIEKRWVAAHFPEGANFSHYGSAECKVASRKGEFPVAKSLPSRFQRREEIEYFFYIGHWPSDDATQQMHQVHAQCAPDSQSATHFVRGSFAAS